MELGDRSTFAIEIKTSEDFKEGRLLLHVNGCSFGQMDFDYNIALALRLFDEVLDESNFHAPELMELDVEGFQGLVDYMYEDCDDVRFKKYENYFEQLDACLIVRLGYYAFDQCLIGLVSNGVEEKIYAIDYDNGNKESRSLADGTVRVLVKQMRAAWEVFIENAANGAPG